MGRLRAMATEVDYPDIEAPFDQGPLATSRPVTLRSETPREFRDLPLQEAVQLALANSPVLRDVGGAVLQSPGSLKTVMGPAIQQTDPRFGTAAALSAFDAQLAATAMFHKNDRALNNIFEGGGTRLFRQDLHNYSLELRKRTATGTNLALRQFTDYDFNNAPGNNVPNLPWGMRVEAEIRQPLLQGAGMNYNRIAGPAGIPGFYNGVLVARVNTDISLADFEAAVTDLVSNVENAYWDLYFAYRDLDAKMAARRRAYETWREVSVLYEKGPGGDIEATSEAQAREQLYRLDAEVKNALAGRVIVKTNNNSLRGTGGVYGAERELRRVMGLPAADGQLLRPSDEPSLARSEFQWQDVLAESLARRVELRRQKWMVKRRELELIASRNYLLPRLDAIGRYRFRGLGHDLLNSQGGLPLFDNALGNLVSGDFQEWAMGVEMSMPIGFRQGHAAVRNAELHLSQERAILAEQERQVVSDLSGAIGELDRSYELAQINYNRRLAAQQELAKLEVLLREADRIEKPRLLDLQLDAQRRLADAESEYYKSLAEHNVAIKNVHYQKGSLLDYDEIYLAEGPWPAKAYRDARRRSRLRIGPLKLDNYLLDGPLVSRGPYPQEIPPPPRSEQTPANHLESLPAPETGLSPGASPRDIRQLPPTGE